MAFLDFFRSKEDVAHELAERVTADSHIGKNAESPEQFDEFVDCTKGYLEARYSKDIMIAYRDAFYSKKKVK